MGLVGAWGCSGDATSLAGTAGVGSTAASGEGGAENDGLGSLGASGNATGGNGGDAMATSGGGDDAVASESTGASEGSSDGDTGAVPRERPVPIEGPCEAPGNPLPCDAESDNVFHALGLGCAGPGNNVIPLLASAVHTSDPNAVRVAKQYGTYIDPVRGEPAWSATEGERFVMLSTGYLAEVDAAGVVQMDPGVHQTNPPNDNPDGVDLPAPMQSQRGSAEGVGGTPFLDCDGVHDCSDSMQAQWTQGGSKANDLVWMDFSLKVPGGTRGYAVDFAYFSSEFPEWVGSSFNDIFVIWSNSEAYTGNLCFVGEQPCTVTALWPVPFLDDAPELVGTGFDGVGGATAWTEAKGATIPGETLHVSFAIFDTGDSVLDSAVLLDNFRWDCQGCVPSEANPCVGPPL